MLARIKELLFSNLTLRQTVLKNAFWLFSADTVGRLLRGAVVIYAARLLGAEQYGLFSYVLSLSVFFSLFSDFGFSGVLTREIVQKPKESEAYVATISFLKIILLFVAAALILLISPLFIAHEGVRILIPITLVFFALDNFRTFSFSITRAYGKMEIEGIARIATDILISILAFLALQWYATPYSLIVAYIIGTSIGILLVGRGLLRQFNNLRKRFQRHLIRPIFSAAWPFAVMGFVGLFMLNIDAVILGLLKGVEAVGFYSAADRPIQIIYAIPSFLSVSLFPIMSALIRDGEIARLRRILERTFTVLFGIALPIVAGGILLGKYLIFFLYGPAYLPSVFTFQLLTLTTLFIFPGTVISHALFSFDRQRTLLTASIIGAVSNVALDFILIPRYGLVGCAVGTLIALLLVHGYSYYRLKAFHPFRILPQLGRVLIATLLMGILVSFFRPQSGIETALAVIGGAITYLVLLIMMREPLLKELRTMIPFLRRS